METLLISLHPRHSQNIFAGKKTIELRKRGVREENHQPAFDRILIYETTPTAEIVGYCEAVEILCKDAQTFCNNYQSSLCLNSREIWDYLGDRMGYGIRIRNPKRIKPISLSTMREVGILPPGDRGKAGSRVSLERGGKPTRAVLTASNILDHDAGH